MPYRTHEEYNDDFRDQDEIGGDDMRALYTSQQTYSQAQMALSILQLCDLHGEQANEKLFKLQEKAVKFLSDYLES
jgi:hypothetical protein